MTLSTNTPGPFQCLLVVHFQRVSVHPSYLKAYSLLPLIPISLRDILSQLRILDNHETGDRIFSKVFILSFSTPFLFLSFNTVTWIAGLSKWICAMSKVTRRKMAGSPRDQHTSPTRRSRTLIPKKPTSPRDLSGGCSGSVLH